ncbi:hypothetical protein PIIN_09848 [Serendipita indica DSM 11827]|uniref:Uncharacterized protein n=1 Tax=Serendipita indica (strain DSM 11827) TaxID=1109443 RepID=G4TX10_SERID|nr:hypothetical protein PIIN_09848 [Serendipita indica DSM 11827]
MGIPFAYKALGDSEPRGLYLKNLGWAINRPLRIDEAIPMIPRGESERVSPRPELERSEVKPSMNVPPTAEYGADLTTRRRWLARRLFQGGLQIPSDWEPLGEADITNFRESTIDSESYIRGYGGATKPERNVVENDARIERQSGPFTSHILFISKQIRHSESPESDEDWWIKWENKEATLNLIPSNTGSLDLIGDWEMVAVLQLTHTSWSCIDPVALRTRDAERHTGRFDYNQRSPNRDIRMQFAGPSWLTLDKESSLQLQEGGFRRKFRRVVANILGTDRIRSYQDFQISRANLLFGLPTIVDVACLPASDSWIWNQELAPILIAAHYHGKDGESTAEILASSFHATLITFILYYLDTRSSVTDQLPTWMVLFGVAYNEDGITIFEHYPVYRTGRGNNVKPGWGSRSSEISTQFRSLFDQSDEGRGQSLALLLRIGSHCRQILSHLEQWDGYSRILEQRFVLPRARK